MVYVQKGLKSKSVQDHSATDFLQILLNYVGDVSLGISGWIQEGCKSSASSMVSSSETMAKYSNMCVCMYILNFTRSWNFGILRVYWVLKSKCIISSNLPAQGSCSKVLTVAIFVESMVHGRRWPSRGLETIGKETVGNSRKQSETVGNSRKQSGRIMSKLSIRRFF